MTSETLSAGPDEMLTESDRDDAARVGEKVEPGTSPLIGSDKLNNATSEATPSTAETTVEKEEDPEDKKLREEMEFKVYLLRITGIQRIGVDKLLSREAEEPDHEPYIFPDNLLDLMDDMLGDKQTTHDQLMDIKAALDIIGGEVTADEEAEIHRQYEALGDEEKIKPLILPGIKDLRSAAAYKLLGNYQETAPRLSAEIRHDSRPMDRKGYPYYTRES
ncbi:hypothetical protein COT78_01355 [Candidatus Berkelbacteria bacterium CG10_big_fil_rev_8_21_14_0_10_43_13]|uniref:Uncharacterized protein n=1 Tax=Candidatus Berkelbacteria bacterium CG10_big_fil_rev_8_21_14_0_10_43_13 TaxID=1974514 RepID=A0A2H0W770_9BACT|nr:MAG: hypothetical protein COT78_01355 [Candidatus Berkelbacteria bacterium CG10_big_fil_rev_8_21_14_0_10_43_13]